MLGGVCPRGFCSRGDFIQGDFVQGFCLGGFCPDTILSLLHFSDKSLQ